MANAVRSVKIIFVISALLAASVASACAAEEMQYKKFILEDVSCNVGLLYRQKPDGMQVGVSAIATGKGSEFRKWAVTDIRLNIDGEAVRPDKEGKFFVRKESLFRVPAAVVFAVLAATADYSGTDLEQGIAAAGMAIGIGLLVLQAHGDIAGKSCVFKLGADTVDRIDPGRDYVRITVEDQNLHLKETINISLVKTPAAEVRRFDFTNVSSGELENVIATLGSRVKALEEKQAGYKYGVDPEYENIGRQIENIETQKGMAYRAWFEKNRDDKKR